MKFFATLALAMVLPVAAQAAVVQQGGTAVGDLGGITAIGGTSVASNNGAYDNSATAISSGWVWIGDISSNNNASFEFNFDLTGYDAATASLSGLWGVDNEGSISLNGTEIASLTGAVFGHFSSLNSYGTTDGSLFNAGLNTLRFDAVDLGGPGAFRATATVSADAISPVPLPAGAPLLLAGLGALGFARRAKGKAKSRS